MLCSLLSIPAHGADEWLQWGGPSRDFTVDGGPLATDWSDIVSRIQWKRPLGDGYSGILFEDGVLYTMFRRGDRDVVTAINAADGSTVWETAYDASPKPDQLVDFGPGPLSTPLIVGDRMYTVSATVLFHCLDKSTGEILWKHDLMEELGAKHLGRGFGASPLARKDSVILTVGGDDSGVVAFDQQSGDIRWKSQNFDGAYPSPILADVYGETQLIIAMGPQRAGLDPDNGELKWKHAYGQTAASVMSTPIWCPDNILFTSAAYSDGSRALRITKDGDQFQTEELWYNRKLRVQHGTFVRDGDYIYGSSGDFGVTLITCLNYKTGDVLWREGGFAKANLLKAGDKVVILDENGDLALTTLTPEGMTVHCRARLLTYQAWTTPTLIGTTLYARDRLSILAIDLAESGGT